MAMSLPARTLATMCTATAMLMLDIAVINTALPQVSRDLHTELSGVQWVIDAYTVALAAIVLTSGSVADRVGRRLSFLAGLALFTLSSAACGLSGSIVMLDASRAVQGVGAAIMFSTSLALIGDAFPDAKARGGALAAYGATIGASFAVGPLVGGALTSGFGWRSIFFLNVPIGVACFVGAVGIAESRDPKPRRPDWLGQVLLAGGLFALVLALLRGNSVGWTSVSTLAELATATIALVAFVAVQATADSPMLPLSLFGNASFTGVQVAAFSISASVFAVYVYVTIYLQNVLGLSPIEAGLVYLPGTVAMFVVAAATSKVYDPKTQRMLVVAGLVLCAAGLAIAVTAGAGSSWFAIEPGLITSLIGAGLFNPALSAIVLRESPVGQTALATGANDLFRQAGVAVGIAVLGALIPAGAALGQGRPGAFVGGFHHALILAAALAGIGAVVAGLLIRTSSPSAAPSEPARPTVALIEA